MAILLIANKRLFSYYQLVSGNAINKADFYLEEGDLSAAEAFYKESVVYDPLNHKANYALGSLALTAENKLQANYYFEQSLQRSPSAYSYAALAQSLFSENDFFQAQFKLQEGLQIFPNSIELLTNLGYLKDISNSRDSSFYYWDKAYSNCQKCEVPQTNLQAFWIENAKSNKIDSIKTALDKGINKSGLDVLSQKPAFHTIEKDSILSLENFAPLFNYYDKFPDKADLNYLISLEKNENNFNFFQELRYLISKGNYAKDKKTKAILSIKQQISDDSAFSKFLSNQLANIYLSEGLFSQGIKSLKRSKDSSALSKSFEEQLLAKEKAYIRMQADIALNDTLAVLKYPYNPIILRRILDDPKNKSQIYNKLLEATEINPNSGEIWKLYSLSSLENGLFSYADSGLEKVRDLVSVAEYTSFKKEFEAKKKTQQGLMEEFK